MLFRPHSPHKWRKMQPIIRKSFVLYSSVQCINQSIINWWHTNKTLNSTEVRKIFAQWQISKSNYKSHCFIPDRNFNCFFIDTHTSPLAFSPNWLVPVELGTHEATTIWRKIDYKQWQFVNQGFSLWYRVHKLICCHFE